jgi:hypothetical protein
MLQTTFTLSASAASGSRVDQPEVRTRLLFPEASPEKPRFRDCFVVEVERDGDRVVVSDPFFNEYGVGATEAEALKDYKASLAAYGRLMAASPEPVSQAHAHLVRQILAF